MIISIEMENTILFSTENVVKQNEKLVGEIFLNNIMDEGLEKMQLKIS
jgi:hypothetical protein